MSSKTKLDYERDGLRLYFEGKPEPEPGTTWQAKYLHKGYTEAKNAVKQAEQRVAETALGQYAHGIRNRLQTLKWSAWPPAARGHSMQLLKSLETEKDPARAKRLHQKLLVVMSKHGQAVIKQIAAQTNTEAAP